MTVKWTPEAVVAAVRRGAMHGIVVGTELVRGEMLRLIMQTEKSGRIYRRGGVEHQASAPGEPPASDTGGLVSSINTVYDTQRLSGRVRVGAAHGPHLEFGTSKMEPRPFARPALVNTRERVEQAVNGEVQRELSK